MQKKTRTEHVGPLNNDNGEVVTGYKEKAELLNGFFSSVYTKEEGADIGQVSAGNTSCNVLNWLNVEMVQGKLSNLNVSKSPGPDGLHPRVLREASSVISLPLFMIFRDSLVSGIVPRDWRKANVVPIFKKGSRSSPGNYRPAAPPQTNFFALFSSLLPTSYRVPGWILQAAARDHLTPHGGVICTYRAIPQVSTTSMGVVDQDYPTELRKALSSPCLFFSFLHSDVLRGRVCCRFMRWSTPAIWPESLAPVQRDRRSAPAVGPP
ncbi:uncharacterized protein LOC130285118 [Hyla sarda]|uniref:uncharacterized protein LOC130285118 n=1 Tax=Hyla sarda TaxID=327740 RepID=UPI0024C4181B|nr:uncharacterized protein LOC130285118 [Hyla sarda]